MPIELPDNWGTMTKAERRRWHQQRILPSSAERIAHEVGGQILEQYLNKGLTTFRRVLEVGNSDTYIVQEGYLYKEELPNGKVITRERPTHTRPLEWARENR